MSVSARTTGSWTTRPAGTRTSQRRENRCQRGTSRMRPARPIALRSPPNRYDLAASRSGPNTMLGAHMTHVTMAAVPAATGKRRGSRSSSPYEDAWTNWRPTSAVKMANRAMPAGRARVATSIASAPPTAAPMVTGRANGATTRAMVKERTEGIANVSITAPHGAQPPMAVVQRTTSLRPATAPCRAAPPNTATTIHATRATHAALRALSAVMSTEAMYTCCRELRALTTVADRSFSQSVGFGCRGSCVER